MFLHSQGSPYHRQGQLRQAHSPGPEHEGETASPLPVPFSPKPGPLALCIHGHRISSILNLRGIRGPAAGTQPTLDMKAASWDLFPK